MRHWYSVIQTNSGDMCNDGCARAKVPRTGHQVGNGPRRGGREVESRGAFEGVGSGRAGPGAAGGGGGQRTHSQANTVHTLVTQALRQADPIGHSPPLSGFHLALETCLNTYISWGS